MKTKPDRYGIAKIAVTVLSAFLAAAMTLFSFMGEIEFMMEDIFYRRRESVPNNIKIIAIDEETLEILGPYSDWDRSRFTELINILNTSEDKRPAVIGLDIIFSGKGNAAEDAALAEAAGRYGNAVTASKLETSVRINGGIENYISGEITAYDELCAAAPHGFTTPLFDSDGYIRRFNGKIYSDGAGYTGFALKIAEAAGYAEEAKSVYEFSYSGRPGAFEAVPMSKVLDGSVPASYFYGDIVIVGAFEEGMMDSYNVPSDHSRNMYGAEIQANMISALLYGKLTHTLPIPVRVTSAFIIVLIVGLLLSGRRLSKSTAVGAGAAGAYIIACMAMFSVSSYKTDILYVPLVIILMYGALLVIRYLETQHRRSEDMQKMLFSMADSMAEAIEGRTPYNANHTKNVAKRCMEMLDFINELHEKKQTKYHFTKNDKKQLYLAAMLHDIGKMDVPTNVMDKPTRLGSKIIPLRSRLEAISLKTEIDALNGRISREAANKEKADIASFLDNLDSYDCGRPLKEHEIAFIDDLGSRVYRGENGEEICYLTPENLDDLHIKAGTLSDNEREIMKSHVVHTDKILSHVYFGKEFDRVRRMAADHHELLNGKGYPLGKSADSLDTMTRILTIMDIYDSLIADDRPYKKPKPINVAFNILDEEAEAGKVDKELLEIAKKLYLERESNG